MPQLHRNNAAEWIMLIALSPFVWMRRLFSRPRTSDPATPRPPRRVMIEGLPPRTMN
ncbi:MAG TPA: hypothetical protein VLI90_08310 [Tepidisphaeraceae bacterium]|nr:hypothetical protein [Tepidisphaeraceae bacterium]